MIILPCKDCGKIPSVLLTHRGHFARCECGKEVFGNGQDLSIDGVIDAWNRVNYVEQRSDESLDYVPELTIDDIYGDEFCVCEYCKTSYDVIEDAIDCMEKCKEKYRIFELEKAGQGTLKL